MPCVPADNQVQSLLQWTRRFGHPIQALSWLLSNLSNLSKDAESARYILQVHVIRLSRNCPPCAGGVTAPISFPTGTLTLTAGTAPGTTYDSVGNTWATTLPAAAGSTSLTSLSFITASTTQLPANTAVRAR